MVIVHFARSDSTSWQARPFDIAASLEYVVIDYIKGFDEESICPSKVQCYVADPTTGV